MNMIVSLQPANEIVTRTAVDVVIRKSADKKIAAGPARDRPAGPGRRDRQEEPAAVVRLRRSDRSVARGCRRLCRERQPLGCHRDGTLDLVMQSQARLLKTLLHRLQF